MPTVNDLFGECWRVLGQRQVKRRVSKYHKARILRFNARHRD